MEDGIDLCRSEQGFGASYHASRVNWPNPCTKTSAPQFTYAKRACRLNGNMMDRTAYDEEIMHYCLSCDGVGLQSINNDCWLTASGIRKSHTILHNTKAAITWKSDQEHHTQDNGIPQNTDRNGAGDATGATGPQKREFAINDMAEKINHVGVLELRWNEPPAVKSQCKTLPVKNILAGCAHRGSCTNHNIATINCRARRILQEAPAAGCPLESTRASHDPGGMLYWPTGHIYPIVIINLGDQCTPDLYGARILCMGDSGRSKSMQQTTGRILGPIHSVTAEITWISFYNIDAGQRWTGWGTRRKGELQFRERGSILCVDYPSNGQAPPSGARTEVECIDYLQTGVDRPAGGPSPGKGGRRTCREIADPALGVNPAKVKCSIWEYWNGGLKIYPSARGGCKRKDRTE
ncbi:hypothetical protein BDN71DRAFT_1495274 [Pleurotus eryngii]|uniref:Uncharacterized protein n=1 Tax=Pleurotus eryngii TaxID=5323 RepID=A0A9P6A264_PLEER|nr:hypothetical protein BDN71DRAFT_1495274 [Pleurotus eryngii]